MTKLIELDVCRMYKDHAQERYILTDMVHACHVTAEEVRHNVLYPQPFCKNFLWSGEPTENFHPSMLDTHEPIWFAVTASNFVSGDRIQWQQAVYTLKFRPPGIWTATGPDTQTYVWSYVHDLDWTWEHESPLPGRLMTDQPQPLLTHQSEEFEVKMTHLPNVFDPDYKVVLDKRVEEETQKILSAVRKRRAWPTCCGEPLQPRHDFVLDGSNATQGFLSVVLECKFKHLK